MFLIVSGLSGKNSTAQNNQQTGVVKGSCRQNDIWIVWGGVTGGSEHPNIAKKVGEIPEYRKKIAKYQNSSKSKLDITSKLLLCIWSLEPTIYMKKLLNSDWLRAVQFKCNTSAKSATPVQILDYDLLKDNGKFSKPKISNKTMTKILYGNFETSKKDECKKISSRRSSGISCTRIFSCLYYKKSYGFFSCSIWN